MLSFLQFLAEMPMAIDYGEENRLSPNNAWPVHRMKHISTTKSGHHVYRMQGKKYPHEGRSTQYAAHDPKTNKTDMEVSGMQKGKHFKVSILGGRKGSTIKADDFYAHLVKKHGLKVHSSDSHSPGGQKVWQKMANRKDIKLSHKNEYQGHNADWESPDTLLKRAKHKVKEHIHNRLHSKLPLDKKNWSNNYEHWRSNFVAKKKPWYKKLLGR